MDIMLFPAAAIAAGGVASWLLRKKPFPAMLSGAGLLCGGALAILILQIAGFCNNGGFSLRFIFELPVLLLSMAAALHSIGYLSGHGEERSGTYWLFLNLTAASMLGVLHAETPLEFLLSWEIMGAASFALVIFDRDNANSCRAGWIYLIACHAGAGLLILLFAFSFSPVWTFVLAVLGFGLKIGFPLLHVWLPEAHPAAPAPVSAVMSGSMIELGFYGILSYGIISGESYGFYGWVLTSLGIVTMLCGIIFALAQKNLKRLLAYSSIENMGILSCGLGCGFLGLAYELPEMIICGFAGAAVHLLNHALFKGGLFLGAGSVYKATGTLDMDAMGGLLRRMPWTGTGFILHSLGICGLPPSAGFAGEFLIYCGAFAGVCHEILPLRALSAVLLIVLAVTGGFAVAAFAKVIGAVFCGEPRSKYAAEAGEVSPGMVLPVWLLFLFSCGLFAGIPAGLKYVCELIAPEYSHCAAEIAVILTRVGLFSLAGLALTALILLFRWLLTRRSGERRSATWDCGYALPDARMEYTATSFSRSMVDFFAPLLRPERRIVPPSGAFPEDAKLTETIHDGGIARFWQPLFHISSRLAEKIHSLQSGSLHFYLLVLAVTLIGMLLGAVLLGD